MEGAYKTYEPVHAKWTVNHGDGHVTEFKPDEDEKAKALFDKLKTELEPKYVRNLWIAAQDQRGQSIKMNTLAAMRRKAAKSGTQPKLNPHGGTPYTIRQPAKDTPDGLASYIMRQAAPDSPK